MNQMHDSAAQDRQQLIHSSKPSRIVAFIFGVLLSAVVLFPLACAFWLLVLHAALTEADMRAGRAIVIGVSRADSRCLQWEERTDGAFVCVKRLTMR